jgi:hypothetical protein
MKKIFLCAVLFVFAYRVCFGYDSAPPGQLFPFPCAVLPMNSETVLCSPGLSGNITGGIFSASYARPYGIAGLESDYLRGGFGGKGFGLSAGVERFGIEVYREDRASVSTGCAGETLAFGVEGFAKRYTLSTEIHNRYTLYDANLHGIVRPLPFFCFGIRQDCLASIADSKRRDILWPGTSIGIGGAPMKGVFMSWNYYRSDIGGINSYSLTVNLVPRLSVSAGYAREISSYALSSSLALGKTIISYGLSYHSYLGATHRAGFSLVTGSAYFEPVNLPEQRIDSDIDDGVIVDLEDCTLEELLSISRLEALHAERIIKWREIMGPVTEKTLGHIGCSQKEIDAVVAHSTGLAEEEEKSDGGEKKFHAKRNYNNANRKPFVKRETKKALFIRLVEAGIPAAKALRISDVAMAKSVKAAAEFINSSKDLNAEEKKKARSVCAQ